MLKSTIPTNNTKFNLGITSEDYSSDRDFYNSKLLDLGKTLAINGVVDSEVVEYQPTYSKINFNVFFLRHFKDNELNEVTGYTESAFISHITKTKEAFGLIDETGVVAQKSFGDPFQIRQPSGILEPELRGEVGMSRFDQLSNKPYVVSNPVASMSYLRPQVNGLPIFYNSFVIPFWDKKDLWINESLLFKDKPYFYYSFLLFEFFDSPLAESQIRLFSIPVFVNKDTNLFEFINGNSVITERPAFELSEGFEGYAFLFLKDYPNTELYVKISFWDALNSNKIQLVPSSEQETAKKWFLDLNNFKQENRYLKYKMNTVEKSYKIYEYNTTTNEYDHERSSFDLYQVFFDEFWVKNPVINATPIDYVEKIVVLKSATDNPIKFSVEKAESFINLESKEISQFQIPLFNGNGFGMHQEIMTFTAKNIDTVNWKIRRLFLKDVEFSTEFNTYNNVFYSHNQSLYNDKVKYKTSEALVSIVGVVPSEILNQQNVLKSYFKEKSTFSDISIYNRFFDAVSAKYLETFINNVKIDFLNTTIQNKYLTPENIGIDLGLPSQVLLYEPRSYLIESVLSCRCGDDVYFTPNEVMSLNLDLYIGVNVIARLWGISQLYMKGNAVMSITNDNNDVKDVIIPINCGVHIKNNVVNRNIKTNGSKNSLI